VRTVPWGERIGDRRGAGNRLPAWTEGAAMTTTIELLPNHLDVTRLPTASFPARYREPTLTAYTQDRAEDRCSKIAGNGDE
jgi:hypothetical protein